MRRFLLAGGLSLALVACGSESESSTATDAPTTADATTTDAPTTTARPTTTSSSSTTTTTIDGPRILNFEVSDYTCPPPDTDGRPPLVIDMEGSIHIKFLVENADDTWLAIDDVEARLVDHPIPGNYNSTQNFPCDGQPHTLYLVAVKNGVRVVEEFDVQTN